MRKQDVRACRDKISTTPDPSSTKKLTRHIDEKDSKKPLARTGILFRGPAGGQPDQPTLATDTKGVQHEKSVISQPQPSGRDRAGGQVDGKVRVADDFGD